MIIIINIIIYTNLGNEMFMLDGIYYKVVTGAVVGKNNQILITFN